MLDNGASNDGAAGDGLFGVVLPARPNNTIIEYYVEAVDATSRTNTWPAAADIGSGVLAQEANATRTGTVPSARPQRRRRSGSRTSSP